MGGGEGGVSFKMVRKELHSDFFAKVENKGLINPRNLCGIWTTSVDEGCAVREKICMFAWEKVFYLFAN